MHSRAGMALSNPGHSQNLDSNGVKNEDCAWQVFEREGSHYSRKQPWAMPTSWVWNELVF
jgi:hypothetical protein